MKYQNLGGTQEGENKKFLNGSGRGLGENFFIFFLSHIMATNAAFKVQMRKSFCNVGLSPSKIVGFICFNDSSLKMMKNAFYFILKALFVLKMLKFFTNFSGYVGKWLDKRAKVNFKIYDVTNWNIIFICKKSNQSAPQFQHVLLALDLNIQ